MTARRFRMQALARWPFLPACRRFEIPPDPRSNQPEVIVTDLQNLLNGVSVPLIALDDALTVVCANRSARKSFPGLVDGKTLDKVVSKKGSLRKRLARTLETSAETSLIVKAKAGFGQEFRATMKLVSGAKTVPRLLLVTFEDRAQAQAVKAMRSDFVANVSHEIRSPLTAISGFVETLQGPARHDPGARDLFLGLMAKEAARVNNLVADLLSLSKVEVKERRALKKHAAPDKVVDQAVAAVSQLARMRGKTLEPRIDQNLPEILGQHDDLVRVLINLLENAINYSRDGARIRLTAGIAPNPNPLARKAIFISIRDQGHGIAAAEIPRLTERFYRVEKSRSRDVGGTGLGLAIVKHILVRHKGRLVIDSTPGKGSTFSVYLPLPKPRKT
jgi:two-component system, OmpR family, phosphate regulon sensor histidine kinase PhoR